MPRVPEEEIERLKREISIERLVEACGVALAKSGEDLIGLCPLHDDKTPSLVITPDKNLWHCLGACQTGGSVIDWVMRREGVSFRHAVEMLRGGAELGAMSGAPPKKGTIKKLSPLAGSDAGDAELMSRVVDVYHATLKESPEALAYLQNRGLQHPEMIERFRLGYANRTLGYRLPDKNRKEGAEVRGRLAELGILRTSGHEHLAGSLVIPLMAEHGRVVQLYGRKVIDNLRAGTPMHLYLPGEHRGVFNREAFSASDEIILCEALIDALTFWCAGYRNVTAAYGIGGFTDEIAQALVEARVRTVKIAFDRDEAGERGAEKVSAKLAAMGIETYRVLFPRGMDANEYALKLGPAEKSLGLVLRQAEWISRGVKKTNGEAQFDPIEETEVRSTGPEIALEEGGYEDIDVVVEEVEETTLPTLSAEPASTEIPLLVASPSRSEAREAPTRRTAGEPLKPEIEEKGEDTFFQFGDRRWRARCMSKDGVRNELRVNLLVTREDERGSGYFVDTVELYSAKQRAAFIKAAAEETEIDERVLRRELGAILLELEARREAALEKAETPTSPAILMTEAEREEALALLRDPNLLDRILIDLERSGIVGEETNKLVGYLAATSRKLDQPLAVVIQSSSAAGKSSLMDAVLALIPEEERVQYSAMTGQSLFYMSGQDLRHKVLAIVEEEGAEKASYALKLLQSEGELTIASTGKDPATGRLVTQTYRVEGPVMIFLTTTAIEVDEELLNRCLVLTVDEGRAQTRAIHEMQRRAQTLEGMLEREERQRIRRVHRNAQRLLRPLFVVNAFAPELTFTDHATRTRRDHMKYLTLIGAVALLHQYQRPVKQMEHRGERLEYIEVTREDIAIANRLASAVLGRSLDELPPQTRRLLEAMHELVKVRMDREALAQNEVRVTRREVREWTKWGPTQVRVHLDRLEELEYVHVHRVGRGASRGVVCLYELAYGGEGADGSRFVMGLHGYDEKLAGSEEELAGSNAEVAGPWRGQNGGLAAGWRSEKSTPMPIKTSLDVNATINGTGKAHPGSQAKTGSYA